MTVAIAADIDLAERPSTELHSRLAELEETRADADGAPAERGVPRAKAVRQREDLEDRQVRAREKGLEADIAKVDERIAEFDRQIRALTTARNRTFSETQAEFDALVVAIPIAEHREAIEQLERDATALGAEEDRDVADFFRAIATTGNTFGRGQERQAAWRTLASRGNELGYHPRGGARWDLFALVVRLDDHVLDMIKRACVGSGTRIYSAPDGSWRGEAEVSQ